MLDRFYISIFNRLKTSMGKKAIPLALYYISFLELALLFALIAFFMVFAKQMKLGIMSQGKTIGLFIALALFVLFKNWMRYNGKRRHVLNAKVSSTRFSLWKLILLPVLCIALAVILLQAL